MTCFTVERQTNTVIQQSVFNLRDAVWIINNGAFYIVSIILLFKDKDTSLVHYVCSRDFTFERSASTRQRWANNCIQRSNMYMDFVPCVELFNILLCSARINISIKTYIIYFVTWQLTNKIYRGNLSSNLPGYGNYDSLLRTIDV